MATNLTMSHTLMEDAVVQNRYMCFYSICFNNTPFCYVIVRGARSFTDKDNFVIGPVQIAELLVRKYSWWESRQWWAELPGHEGISDPKRRHGGARWKIRASGSSSQMTHSLPKSHGGGPSLQRLSGSPAQKRMKGINEVASENAVPPAASLKAHLHLFHPHTELN